MKVVLAEKPSVAREIAAVVGASRKQDGYLEGNGYIVTYAVGHLVRLADMDSYENFHGKSWKEMEDHIPYVPERFKLTLANDSIKKQYFTVKKLFDQATEIIVATDAGQEGELIFRYIYALTGSKAPFKRLWISSLTTQAIREGFQNLKPGQEYDNLFYSAKARSEADWVIGINLTRLYTIKYRSESVKVVSIGRVQTPTLNLICARFLENTNFKPEQFFVPTLLLLYRNLQFKAKYIHRLKSKAEAEKIIANVSTPLTCTGVEKSTINTAAPMLYNLTHLQQDINKKFGYSAKETLDLLQTLYEKKLVTYPRTESNYLSSDMQNLVTKLVVGLAQTHVPKIGYKIENNEPFDDKRVTDHHAIIPIDIHIPENLAEQEKIILSVVIQRTLQAFSSHSVDEKTELQFGEFRAVGKIPVQDGWKAINLLKVSEDESEEENDDDTITLPPLEKGNSCEIVNKSVQEGFTQPPALYTEASLLKVMEHASNRLEESEIKFGIGTPATRAGIIETLLLRNYITRRKKKLIPTTPGLSVYQLTKDSQFGQIALTAEFESRLLKIKEGLEKPSKFMQDIITLTSISVVNARNATMEVSMNIDPVKIILCPMCKQGHILPREKFFGCSSWKIGCNFKIWKEFLGKSLTLAQIDKICKTGISNSIKFKSKAGKEFDAKIKLIVETGKLKLEFDKLNK